MIIININIIVSIIIITISLEVEDASIHLTEALVKMDDSVPQLERELFV